MRTTARGAIVRYILYIILALTLEHIICISYYYMCVREKETERIEREREYREKNYGHWYALNGNAQITVFILYIKNAYGRV